MEDASYQEQDRSMARIFDIARIFFLLIVIPLALLVFLIYTGIFEVGKTTKEQATAVLDEQFQNEIKIRAVNTAAEVSKFLEERKGDILVAALLPKTADAYRAFAADKKGTIMKKEGDRFRRVPVPLYKEISLTDRWGRELIRISDGETLRPAELRDVSLAANTTYKSEDYFSRTKELEEGEVYFSHVTGWYVNRPEYEEGRRFSGIIRVATPLFEQGTFSGLLSLALDMRHLAEFTDHLVPTQAEHVKEVDPSTGNYAYMVDNRGFIISHPIDYHIAGLYRDGTPVQPFTEGTSREMTARGEEVLNMNLLGFMDAELPEIARAASEGQSGIKLYTFGGHTKFVAYAPIEFQAVNYPPPGGFGWIGMGVDVDKLSAFMTSTFASVQKEVETWTKTVIIILILSVILLLLISALLAKGMSRQYKVIAKERAKHLEVMKQEFQERERTLLQIVQGSTIPTFVINKDHIVTHWNTSLERLTGYKAADFIGTKKHWKAFYSGEKPILADLIVDNVNEEELKRYYGETGRSSPFIEGAYEAETLFHHIGEGGRWLYFTAAPIKGPDGTVIGAIETLWDRTDSKLLYTERERHLRQLSILWKITTAMSATMDPDERIRVAGNEIFDNFDIDSLAVYSRGTDDTFRIVYSFGYRDSMYQKGCEAGADRIVEIVAATNEVMFFEDIAVDNEPYPEFAEKEGLLSAACVPLTSREGGILGVALISSHVSKRFSEEDKNLLVIISNHVALEIENARLHHEAKLFGQSLELRVKEKTRKLENSYNEIRLSEEKYRTMFDSDPNPIIITDRETLRLLDVNVTATECYGYTRDEFIEKTFLDLMFQIDQEVLEGLESIIAPNQSLIYPKKLHKKKDGSPFYVDVNISSVKFMGKDCLIVNTPNVTEHVEKETQLIQASKMATLGTMASGIAHEISQPLNVMQVCSDFIMKAVKKGQTITEEELYTIAEEIEKNVQRAAKTITHMKDFVRKSEASGDRLNINRPIVDVFKLLGQQLRVHGIEVELDLSDDLPSIMADHNRLEQVFINLVTNARDALDEKESKINGRRQWEKLLKIKSYSENGRVLVTVFDNGTGIPKDVKDKIFEPFFTTKEVGKGTGLGITISYGIIKDYGGKIDVESTVGLGTTFTLIFPAAG